MKDGAYRCPSSQQGYSPFTTWTRGLAWILCGYAEQLEFLAALPETAFAGTLATRRGTIDRFLEVATATADFFIANTPTDGVPYWDTGRAGPRHAWATTWARGSEPFNDHEPVDSSAAAIAAQGLLRLGNFLAARGQAERGHGATARPASPWPARSSPSPTSPTDPAHEGLLLHTVYHRPNGWDHVPPGAQGALRRVRDVGRLPRPRARAAHPARGRGRALPQVLPGLTLRSSARRRR